MFPEAGQFVGPYEILGQIGSGGMGVVFRAWDERLHREVALKLLHDAYGAPNLRERFLIEARAASALNHPNICTIFDLGEQDGEPFLVMELLSGQTVKEKIAQSVIETEEIVRVSSEVADALAWAHAKGIIHRDIKPANIFLLSRPGGQSQAKVLDFGLAKVTAASRSGRASHALEITSVGSTVGTLAYMSPEQARGEALDARSDLFSLGVVMYEMCTRRVPFRGATSALVFTALLSQAPEPIREWNSAVPRDLDRLIMRLLAKDRSERVASAQELHDALRRLAMKDEGDWLRKLPRPAIPLVPSLDPVARAGRRWRGQPDDPLSSSGELALPLRSEPAGEGDENMLRPRRLPQRESGPRESAFGAIESGSRATTDPGKRWESSGDRAKGPEKIDVVTKDVMQASGTSEFAKGAPDVATEPAGAATLTLEATESVAGGNPDRVASTPSAAVAPEELAPANAEQSATQAVAATRAARASGTPPHRRRWLAIAIVALLLAGFDVYELVRGSFAEVVLRPGDAVLLAPIENRSGDAELDRSVMQGIEIELTENSTLHFEGLSAFRAGRRQIMAGTHASEQSVTTQTVAERLGARAYLYGELVHGVSGYTLTINVVDAASNDRMASLSESCATKDGIAAMVTDLSVALRRRLGEGEVAQTRSPTPLARQATGNMAALEAYAEAGLAVEEGRSADGLSAYRRAAALDPNFALAMIRSAWLGASQGAEVEAAEAATEAQKAAGRAGDRVAQMAKYTRQALADRDLTGATATARAMNASRPADAESLLALARVMRLGGHMTEALLSAEQATRRSPFHLAAVDEEAHALIGLDRYGDALHLESTTAASGLICDCGRTAAAYLSGGPMSGGGDESTAADVGKLTDRALAADNSGQWDEGLRLWRQAAATAQAQEGLGSAAAGVLAQAALDRALAGRCTETMALETADANMLHGPTATFRDGVARAFCGGTTAAADGALAKAAALHTEIAEALLPMLRAAVALHGRQPMQALGELSGVREQRDAPPLGVLLRGMAHLAGKQGELAADDFSAIMTHRGRAFLSGSAVYAPALSGLVRARLTTGDRPGAEAARMRLEQIGGN